MDLESYSLPSVQVQVPGGELAVRGLSLDDLTKLVRNHGDGLASFFDMLVDVRSGRSLALSDLRVLAGALAEAAPDALADAIALAADQYTPSAVATVKRLPGPVQIDLLERIGELTFATEGGAKKALETIIRVAQGARSALTSLRS